MMAGYIVYAYPIFKRLSWTVIAQNHVKQLRKYFNISTIDERALPLAGFITKPLLILQPYFYPVAWMREKFINVLNKVSGVIGVDVADSNKISEKAVKYTKLADALIVPSEFSRKSYLRSGVKKPVYVVPHGVDEDWITCERKGTNTFDHLAELKDEGYKILLSFVMHSPLRKGMDILVKINEKLTRERKDFILVVKTPFGVGYLPRDVKYIPTDDEDKTFPIYGRLLEGKVNKIWFDEGDLLELFDLADIYIVGARGGGFEHDGLRALARGVPTIGAKGGSWCEYIPKWGWIDSKESGRVLPKNDIHIGTGYEMIIDKAVDKIHHIIDNLDDYKARAREYAEDTIMKEYTWDAVGSKLAYIISKYCEAKGLEVSRI